jgi:hypothetical protein
VHVAGASGDIYCWDLRGGRQATTAFVAPNQARLFPLPSLPPTQAHRHNYSR